MLRRLSLLATLALATTLIALPLFASDEPYDRRPDEAADYDATDLYNRICVTCHGDAGDGQGMALQLFSFGAPEEEWRNGPTVEGVLITLDEGLHGTSMRPFPEYTEEDRRRLAAYILELREALLAEDNE